MIIDLILERRTYEKEEGDKQWYGESQAKDLYVYAMSFGFDYLSRALDAGGEGDIRKALCRYIDENGYRPEIKEFVNSVDWLPKGMGRG